MTCALITGASAGLGLELAKLFAADGHDLVLVARREEKLQALADELTAKHAVRVTVVARDLAVPDAAQSIFDEVRDAEVHVDFLVNNAGFGSTGLFHENDIDRELGMVQVNVTALTALTRLFVPGMIAKGFGRVLNIASTAAFQAGPGMSVYFATKAYVVHFSEGIAHELRGTGVTVTAHCPGATHTEFAKEAGNDKTPLFKGGGVADAPSTALDAYRAMNGGKVVAIHGFKNWLGAFMTRFAPRRVLRNVAAKLNGL